MSALEFELPLRLVSESNRRDHWRTKARRAQSQRATAFTAASAYRRVHKVQLPVRVHIQRTGKRLLDGDNLQSACKAVRDGIADAFQVTDADERVIRFTYGQGFGVYGVRVSIEKLDIVQDFIDVVTSMCARIYGRRAASNRAKKALAATQEEP